MGIAPTTVKKRATGYGRARECEVAESVAAIYAELKPYMTNGTGAGFRLKYDTVAVGRDVKTIL